MRARIAVGDVELELDGIDLTKADISRLLKRAAMIAAALTAVSSSIETDSSDSSESKDLDAHVTLASDDVPLFGFTTWRPEDPEWVPEEAP